MSADLEPCLTPAELAGLLQAADPAALLVAPRLLRRAIKHDRKLTGLGLQVPHRRCYVIGREALLELAGRDELGVEPDRQLPPTLLLIARPEAEELAAMPRGPALVKYWRLLFHCRVHLAIAISAAEQRLSAAGVRARIHRIGQTEFDEVRTVLRQEKLLLPPRDDRTAYEEFAALYLELSFFAAPQLPRYFPSMDDFGRIDELLAQDVDAAALFAATRLKGAPDPVFTVDVADRGEQPGRVTNRQELLAELKSAGMLVGADHQYQDLLARADKATAAGNVVRAAVQRTLAANMAAALGIADDDRGGAGADVDRLVERLRTALHMDPAEAELWRQALPALLGGAATGIWPAEARLLYDLQTVCIDHERTVYSPDLVEWAYAGFRRPLLLPLPNQSLVLAVKHLRSAVSRLPSVRVTEAARHALSVLLHGAVSRAEDRLRERFRPILGDALDAVGLRPQNFPERRARDKLVEELLDQVGERGYLDMGDLRDALSRNQLKLPDLSGPGEFFGGDPLLRANRELAVRAAGVYRRGPVYLRWLQRGSALTFGTHPGRWFTRYLALPFGAAFATIVMIQEILHLLHVPHHLEPAPLGITVGLLGVFYLLLLHVPPFRGLVAGALRLGWRAARTVLFDLPAAFLRLRPVRLLLDSAPFLIFMRYVLKPAPAALLTWAVLSYCGISPGSAAVIAGATLLTVSVLLNSRLGRDLEELATDWTVRRWEYLRGLLPGLVRLVLDLFKGILEAVDRFLYTVDEWLRFRSGEGRMTLAAKTVLGFVWFLVAYVIRLYANVLIEPAINPVKHFPAVTVAAKMLVPFWLPLTELLATPLMFLGGPLAYTIAFLQLHALPGAAGFLVWELKENWRLYRANRPPTLGAVAIGHHGETLLRLMKPGFHSGTLPKLYAKLRRAERRAERSGAWRPARRLRETLHHVENSIRRFADRDLLAFLGGSKIWTAGPVQLAAVEAGSNRIRLELACPALGEHNLELKFEEQSGWLLAHVARAGWLARLAAPEKATLALALTGFYKEAGVDLLREQIEASFAPERPPYDIADKGLVVWPGPGYESEIVYDLREGPVLYPRSAEGPPPARRVELQAAQLLFSSRAVTWQSWVEAWERDQSGVALAAPLLPEMRVLPAD